MQVSNATAASGTSNPFETKAALQKAAQQFEAVFLRQMIGAMRSASLAEGITDSSATQQFQDMADARTADAMSTKGAMGIAELL
ncbi:MAG: rod-binding protein, partial [Sphingomonas sp.]